MPIRVESDLTKGPPESPLQTDCGTTSLYAHRRDFLSRIMGKTRRQLFSGSVLSKAKCNCGDKPDSLLVAPFPNAVTSTFSVDSYLVGKCAG